MASVDGEHVGRPGVSVDLGGWLIHVTDNETEEGTTVENQERYTRGEPGDARGATLFSCSPGNGSCHRSSMARG